MPDKEGAGPFGKETLKKFRSKRFRDKITTWDECYSLHIYVKIFIVYTSTCDTSRLV